MIVNIHSSILRVCLTNNAVTFKTIVNLTGEHRLELLLKKNHVLIDCIQILSLALLILAHVTHVTH